MCYAIPGRLVDIQNNIGIVDYFGEKRRVRIDYSNVKIGDYVYAQGGIIVNRINPQEAEEILGAWEEVFFALKEKDKKLSERNEIFDGKSRVFSILQKVNQGGILTREDIKVLISVNEDKDKRLLFDFANNIRYKEHGNACCVHGIIEFSNICRENCFYCGIRKHADISRYRMQPSQIISWARYAVEEFGFKALVLQSGEDLWYDENNLKEVVKEIRDMGVLVFLSVGMRDKDFYKKMFDYGVRAVLLRFETSNKETFSYLRPYTSFEERLELIRYLKDIGYIVATGFLVGLPKESQEDVVENILLARSFKPEMYSFGPLIPVRGSPLGEISIVDEDLIYKIIAIIRILDRNASILVTTAMETLSASAIERGFMAGANSLMINVTPLKYRRLYKIYDNRAHENSSMEDSIERIKNTLYSLGRAPTDIGLKNFN